MIDQPKNVFISHIHEDDATLKGLRDLLRRNGYEIRDGSIDSSKPNDATNADYIKSEILAPRIRWAGTFIVLISAKTHESRWVDWEIEYAHKQGKRIIGVRVVLVRLSDHPVDSRAASFERAASSALAQAFEAAAIPGLPG